MPCVPSVDTARRCFLWHMLRPDGDKRWAKRYLTTLVGFSDEHFGSFTADDEIRILREAYKAQRETPALDTPAVP